MDELHPDATAERRAATVLRTEELVVLKYSLNLLADPDFAAVEAALASDAQFEREVRMDDLWDDEQSDCSTTRS